MAGNAFNNLGKLFLNDTFRAWFDKTNEIVETVNPLEIYGVTLSSDADLAGITYEIDANGIVSLGLIPDQFQALASTTVFSNPKGTTFTTELRVSGQTVDFGTATLYGGVVRSVNGLTGDVTFSTVATPGTAVTGDILIFNEGGTYEGYKLFSGGTFAKNTDPFHIGTRGGIFIGVTSGGASAAVETFITKGNIQLVGESNSGIYFSDNSQSVLTSSKIAGADIRYGTENGSQLFTIGGRNLSGIKHGTKNLILDFNKQTMSVGGAATGPASINIGDLSGNSKPILYTDTSGSTFTMRYFTAGETAGGRTSGGITGVAAFGGNPSTKGLLSDERLRFEYTEGSVEFEIDGTSNSAFVVYGKSTPYGDLLVPSLVARKDGDVVIGAINATDGGITGTSHGSLNIASGKLYVGGTLGSVITQGYQVLSSNGVTSGWRVLNSTVTSLDGSIGIPTDASLNDTTGLVDISITYNSIIPVVDHNNENILGPFSATINLPQMIVKDYSNSYSTPIIGVRMILDGINTDKYITWQELWSSGLGVNKIVSPSFTFTGNAGSSVKFIAFASTLNGQFFEYAGNGSYLITFNKLG